MNKLLLLAGAAIIFVLSSFTRSHDGKAGATGSPGESNCSECHSEAVNTGGGHVSFSSNIQGGIYSPGKTYEITVTVGRKGSKMFGLDVEALLNANNKNAGTFVITNKAETQLLTEKVNSENRNNVTHQFNGGKANDSKAFKFNWTAPASDAGNLTFYVAALAANGDDSPSGDFTYTATQLIKSANGGNDSNKLQENETTYTATQLIKSANGGNDSNKLQENETTYTKETFGFTKVLNGQSVEVPEKGNMNLIISHHFGQVNQGPYEFWGLDEGTVRIGLEYGVIKNLSVDIGRNEYDKTFDGGIKYKFLKQSKGKKHGLVTLDVFFSTELNSMKWTNTNQTNYFSSRLSYVWQVLVARKFGDNFSLQLTPTVVHNNLALTFTEPNDIIAVGAGARYKLNRRLAISGEYYYLVPGQLDKTYKNEVAIGLDIQTAKHFFQLQFTNAQPMFERAFITETTGQVSKGDIYFGFNISRTFSIAK